MERALPCYQSHYSLPTPAAVYPGFVCHPLTVPPSASEYFLNVPFSRPESRSSKSDALLSGGTDWTTPFSSDRKKRFQAPFDMDTLKAAIQAAAPDSGEVRKAIQSSTFKPRERAFTRLINMCGRQKESRKALEVFAAMCESRGVRPNTYTYSALISACSHAGDWDSAIEVYQRMKNVAKTDPGCLPNQVTFNAIIAASERGCRYDVCLSCFYDMADSDACPDSANYCSAINACQKLGRWDEAEKILADMHSQDVVATLGVYSIMIDHYATHSSWKLALDLFLTMQMHGRTVDTRCCRGLMAAFEAGQQPEMAYQLLEAMWANGMAVGTTLYVIALRLFASAAMWEQALEVVTKLSKKGNKIPSQAVKLVVKSMKSAGKEDYARRVESIVKQCGIDLQQNKDPVQ